MRKNETAEQVAMKDISNYVKLQANDITILYNQLGWRLSPYSYWDNNINMVISKMFVSVMILKTKENRKLNKKLII
tara:strand:+ start:234 stop:461 length:228 start_codon:yes stop_codon:yes gene_type:complete